MTVLIDWIWYALPLVELNCNESPATGNVTLDASAFNLSGLESLRLGSVGGLIGAAVNEFSTDGTLSQNSNTKVPTQNAVKTYVDTEL